MRKSKLERIVRNALNTRRYSIPLVAATIAAMGCIPEESADVSSDGRYVAFTANYNGEFDCGEDAKRVVWYDLETDRLKVFDENSRVWWLAVSPRGVLYNVEDEPLEIKGELDGKRIEIPRAGYADIGNRVLVYTRVLNDNDGVLEIVRNGRTLHTDIHGTFAKLSPNGKRIAYLTFPRDDKKVRLEVLGIDGKNRKTIASLNELHEVANIRWADDDHLIFGMTTQYTGDDVELFCADCTNGKIEQLTNDDLENFFGDKVEGEYYFIGYEKGQETRSQNREIYAMRNSNGIWAVRKLGLEASFFKFFGEDKRGIVWANDNGVFVGELDDLENRVNLIDILKARLASQPTTQPASQPTSQPANESETSR